MKLRAGFDTGYTIWGLPRWGDDPRRLGICNPPTCSYYLFEHVLPCRRSPRTIHKPPPHVN